MLLPMIVYDLATLKRVNRVTIVSSLLIVLVLFLRIPLGMTSLWLKFATFMGG